MPNMKEISLTKISFDFREMKWQGITVSQIKLWERLYPDVDVDKCIQFDMIQWIDKRKDTKIAHKKDWKKTICNWLKREQERRIG